VIGTPDYVACTASARGADWAPVLIILLVAQRAGSGPLLIMFLTLVLALYLTVVELREFEPRPHWKWWAWWLSFVFFAHFVGYLVLRAFHAFHRWRRARV
jgi:hypothetical protein